MILLIVSRILPPEYIDDKGNAVSAYSIGVTIDPASLRVGDEVKSYCTYHRDAMLAHGVSFDVAKDIYEQLAKDELRRQVKQYLLTIGLSSR